MRKNRVLFLVILMVSGNLVHGLPVENSDLTVWDEEFLLPPGPPGDSRFEPGDVTLPWTVFFTPGVLGLPIEEPSPVDDLFLEDLPLW